MIAAIAHWIFSGWTAHPREQRCRFCHQRRSYFNGRWNAVGRVCSRRCVCRIFSSAGAAP